MHKVNNFTETCSLFYSKYFVSYHAVAAWQLQANYNKYGEGSAL